MSKPKRLVDPCSIEGCEKPTYSKGWCKTHYYRNYNYGSPLNEATGRAGRKPRVVGPCQADHCDAVAPLKIGLYCEKHYWRHRTHGDANYIPRHAGKNVSSTAVDNLRRYWSHVDTSGGPDACWGWSGPLVGRDSGKYGTIGLGGKSVRAHRMAYELANNVVLLPHQPVHHICANSLCQNPKHLQVVTPEENTAEMLERKYYKRKIAELEAEVERLNRLLTRDTRSGT